MKISGEQIVQAMRSAGTYTFPDEVAREHFEAFVRTTLAEGLAEFMDLPVTMKDLMRAKMRYIDLSAGFELEGLVDEEDIRGGLEEMRSMLEMLVSIGGGNDEVETSFFEEMNLGIGLTKRVTDGDLSIGELIVERPDCLIESPFDLSPHEQGTFVVDLEGDDSCC